MLGECNKNERMSRMSKETSWDVEKNLEVLIVGLTKWVIKDVGS
jgi:hypothetical protein